MNYLALIADSLGYIEQHLYRAVTLDELAERSFLSKFHFYRIFRAVTGQTLKTYVNERRLTEAAKHLRASNTRILDIALGHGYNSHEAFIRSFKKRFGVTPTKFRNGEGDAFYTEPLEIVERDFKNQNRDIVVHYQLVEIGPLHLVGRHTVFDLDSQHEVEGLAAFVMQFVHRHMPPDREPRLYTVADSGTYGRNEIIYTCAFEANSDGEIPPELQALIVPRSIYALLEYRGGGMKDIHETVLQDLYKCILVAGLELNPIGIDFFQLYEADDGVSARAGRLGSGPSVHTLSRL